MAGEQQRLSNSEEEEEEEEEDGGEEQTEQHDKDTQPALVTEHNDEEKQTAAAQGQSAPLVTEAWQDTAKAGVRRSYVHQRWLEVQREMFQGAPRELQRLIETRWACRYNACKTVRDRLSAIIRLLKEISEEQNGDRAVEARDTIFMTSTPDATAVFEDSLPLSLMAPGPSLDALSAIIPSMSLPELIHIYVPDPQLTPAAPASAPEMTTPQPLSVQEIVPSCEATATSTLQSPSVDHH
ncbi:unnamed protein product [Leuciscus chuanchicus]